jgi:hypothetical protein
MMKLGLLLCAATAVAAIPDGSVSAEVRAQFDDFKLEFGKHQFSIFLYQIMGCFCMVMGCFCMVFLFRPGNRPRGPS